MVNNGSSSSHMELHKTHLVEMDQHVASIDSGTGCELAQIDKNLNGANKYLNVDDHA
jgi:hypothetical protein